MFFVNIIYMKWIAISGSWRRSSPKIEQDVKAAVAHIIMRGDGIITGGALGVDFVATEEALSHDPSAEKIRIIIPTPLEVYAAHYRKRATEGVITSNQAEALISLLTDVRSRRGQSLVEMGHSVLNEETYYDRNTKVLENASGLLAFQVNGSLGTQDTIDKARDMGLEVSVRKYEVSDSDANS